MKKEINEEMLKKDKLDSILKSIDDEVNGTSNLVNKDLIKEAKDFVDFESIMKECEAEAHMIIDSMTKFYLDGDSLTDEYIMRKTFNDKLVMSKILFQIKTAEYAAKKLLEQIATGSYYARNFEVLAGLQRSQMEIVKHMVQVQTVMENSYKLMADDFRTKVNFLNSGEPSQLEPRIMGMSSKTMIQNLTENMNVVDENLR